MTEPERLSTVIRTLAGTYGEVKGFLSYRSDFELLIAVILSAQTTDRQVNLLTPELFARYPTPAALAAAKTAELEALVRSSGYFRAKARNIRETSRQIMERFGGRVPESMEELTSLPGVGRKSANVVRGALFKQPAIIVDTHFARVTTRLGFTTAKDPGKIERELAKKVAPEEQYRFSMLMNKHGRVYCHARKPDCPICPVEPWCPWPFKTKAIAEKK